MAPTLALSTGETISIKSWNPKLAPHPEPTGKAGMGSEQGDFDEIPIVDLQDIYSDDLNKRKAVAAKVRHACSVVGFFYAKNIQIDPALTERVLAGAREFFALPHEKKMEVSIGRVPGQFVGYHHIGRYNREGRKYAELNEAFNIQYDPAFDPDVSYDGPPEGDERKSLFLSEAQDFNKALIAYTLALTRFSRRLSRCFALALNMPEDYFDELVRFPKANMRVLRYPAQENSPDDQAGLGYHTDFEAWTILYQHKVSGLQVLNKKGEFIQAPPIPGTVVINIGDLLQRQSNDFFRSTIHRVVNTSGVERMSCPYFFGYSPEAVVEVVPSCTSASNPAKYEPIKAKDWIKYRANRTTSAGYNTVVSHGE